MAQKVTVALEDDLDGGPADETVRFGVDGTEYEIDLSTKNAWAFRTQLAPFLEHARTPGRGPARRTGRTAAGRQRSGEVRAWAKDHGLAVSARGRIPASVVELYQAAAKDAEPSGDRSRRPLPESSTDHAGRAETGPPSRIPPNRQLGKRQVQASRAAPTSAIPVRSPGQLGKGWPPSQGLAR
jgi:nucleoid-associated protein Lsr2